MKYLSKYLEENADLELKIHSELDPDIIVVIPAYDEDEATVLECLRSLEMAAAKSRCNCLVSLLLNYKSISPDTVKIKTHSLFNRLKQMDFNLELLVFLSELKTKKAGVGVARKKLMDAALSYFQNAGKNGLIVNLDADTIVEDNYFNAIYDYFNSPSSVSAASIYFEHRYTEEQTIYVDAINAYELHLRCFINMQRLLALPYAFQTIGSAMAVRAYDYARVGGMPRRQAGEDFYFIHKFTKLDELGEINETCVYPSNRESNRVPFGTGKAVLDLLKFNADHKSYNWKSFEILQYWLDEFLSFQLSTYNQSQILKDLNIDDEHLKAFMQKTGAIEEIRSIIKRSKNFDSFLKSFFQWFDAFSLMKYLHHMRDAGYEDVDVLDCSRYLFDRLGLDQEYQLNGFLRQLQKIDRSSGYPDQWRAALISRLSSISASRSTHQAKRE